MTFKQLKNISGYWYLATPYSKWPEGTDMAFIEACRQAGNLISQGIKVYCPIAHTHPIACYSNIDRFSHEIWMPVDTPLMQGAHGLIVCKMPGWNSSKGINEEIEFFTKNNKPVVYLEYSK